MPNCLKIVHLMVNVLLLQMDAFVMLHGWKHVLLQVSFVIIGFLLQGTVTVSFPAGHFAGPHELISLPLTFLFLHLLKFHVPWD